MQGNLGIKCDVDSLTKLLKYDKSFCIFVKYICMLFQTSHPYRDDSGADGKVASPNDDTHAKGFFSN